MTNTLDIDKAYVSPYDVFMRTFDTKNPPSKSQLKEIQKHQIIAQLRDNKQLPNDKEKIWEAF